MMTFGKGKRLTSGKQARPSPTGTETWTLAAGNVNAHGKPEVAGTDLGSDSVTVPGR
jgi:hypothetical protein